MKSFIALLFTALIYSCNTPERNCANFHKGTFEFEPYLNGELAKTTFIRNDSIEIDFFQGKSDTASIRWINDCEYIVRKLNPKSMAEEKAIHMKILTTDGNTYTFEYGLVGAKKNKQKGTAIKVK